MTLPDIESFIKEVDSKIDTRLSEFETRINGTLDGFKNSLTPAPVLEIAPAVEIEPAPVEPAPAVEIEPAQVEPAPVESAPVEPLVIESPEPEESNANNPATAPESKATKKSGKIRFRLA